MFKSKVLILALLASASNCFGMHTEDESSRRKSTDVRPTALSISMPDIDDWINKEFDATGTNAISPFIAAVTRANNRSRNNSLLGISVSPETLMRACSKSPASFK